MKFVLQFTFPNGQKALASRLGPKFILAPVLKNKSPTMFIVFDTKLEAAQFFEDIKTRNPVKSAILLDLKPEIVPVEISKGKILPAPLTIARLPSED